MSNTLRLWHGCAVLFALVGLSDCGDHPPSFIKAEDIAALESCVHIPFVHSMDSPRPLEAYRRYYSGVLVHNRRMIRGEFLRGGKPGIYVVGQVRSLPLIYDGGCGVVNVLYDIALKRVVAISCNGYA